MWYFASVPGVPVSSTRESSFIRYWALIAGSFVWISSGSIGPLRRSKPAFSALSLSAAFCAGVRSSFGFAAAGLSLSRPSFFFTHFLPASIFFFAHAFAAATFFFTHFLAALIFFFAQAVPFETSLPMVF